MTKEERKQKAVNHTEYMQDVYHDMIQDSIEQTDIFDGDFDVNQVRETSIKVLDSTTENIVHEYGREFPSSLTILNFASYTRPGGGFINGAIAQEEALCHDSFLYNVLKEFTPYYNENYDENSYPYYKNKALYTPNILFNQNCVANVITCAAPNISAIKYKMDWDYVTYKSILDSRIDFILKIAVVKNTKILVLGAFGCGVFGNDPQLVAELFKKNLHKYYFEQVIFAIPNTGNDNYEVFKKVFEN